MIKVPSSSSYAVIDVRWVIERSHLHSVSIRICTFHQFLGIGCVMVFAMLQGPCVWLFLEGDVGVFCSS